MAASYPKGDDERRNRTEPKFGWTDVEPSVTGAAPALPPIREWSDETLRWWSALWTKGQSALWDQTGASAVPMAVLWEDLQHNPEKTHIILAELRQHDDRHGLNPKAMLQLRWRFVAAEEPAVSTKAGKAKRTDRRTRVLQVVPSTDAS